MGRELIEERTLYRKVFLQPDGTKKARIYTSPVHYINGKIGFEDITSKTQFEQISQNIVSTQNAITDRHIIYPEDPISNTIYGGDVFPNDYLPVGNAEYIYYKFLTIPVWDEYNQQWVDIDIMQYDVRGISAKTLIKIDIDSLAVTGTITDAKLNVYLADRYWYSSAVTDSLCNVCLLNMIPPLSYLCDDYSCPEYGPNPGEQYQYISASIITDSTDWWDPNNYLPTYEDTTLFHIDSIGNMMTFNVLNAMEGWKNGAIDNHGLILQSSQITDARRMFHLYRYSTYAPYFEITYTDSVEPKLRIIEPDSTAIGECILPYLDENLPIDQIYPVMPEITCKAVFDGLNSLTTDTVDVNWEYIVEYDYKKRNGGIYTATALDTMRGLSQLSGTDTTVWLVDFTDRFLGGNVSIIASAVINDSTYSDTLNNIYEIRGTNPKQNIVRDYIAYRNPNLMYELWAIMYYETEFYSNQFIGFSPPSDVGLPLYGYPAGYGLFQLDPVTNGRETLELWNWKENVNSGTGRFLNKKNMFLDNNMYQIQIIDRTDMYKNYHKKEWKKRKIPLDPQPFTEQQLMIDWMQLYNGGHYWAWVPADDENQNGPGIWEAHPEKDKKQVGLKYYNKSVEFRQGNFPPPNFWNSYYEGCQ